MKLVTAYWIDPEVNSEWQYADTIAKEIFEDPEPVVTTGYLVADNDQFIVLAGTYYFDHNINQYVVNATTKISKSLIRNLKYHDDKQLKEISKIP